MIRAGENLVLLMADRRRRRKATRYAVGMAAVLMFALIWMIAIGFLAENHTHKWNCTSFSYDNGTLWQSFSWDQVSSKPNGRVSIVSFEMILRLSYVKRNFLDSDVTLMSSDRLLRAILKE